MARNTDEKAGVFAAIRNKKVTGANPGGSI